MIKSELIWYAWQVHYSGGSWLRDSCMLLGMISGSDTNA